jgi:chromosome partitioning protein
MVLLPLVVVDLEGTAAKIVVLAVSQPGLALIPIQGSQDAERAS